MNFKHLLFASVVISLFACQSNKTTNSVQTDSLTFNNKVDTTIADSIMLERYFDYGRHTKFFEKLGKSWANGLYHLSYGMVDLPSGKMKSREGTVVDADDLIDEMVDTARQKTEELGKTNDFSEVDKEELYNTIGLGALKYFLLKVEPKKRLLFDPAESIDFQGNTGPFIQYTHARIKSLLSRANYSFALC